MLTLSERGIQVPGQRFTGPERLPTFPERYVWLMRYGRYILILTICSAFLTSIWSEGSSPQSPYRGTLLFPMVWSVLLAMGASLYAVLLWGALSISVYSPHIVKGFFKPEGVYRLRHWLLQVIQAESRVHPALLVFLSSLVPALYALFRVVSFNSAINMFWPLGVLALGFASERYKTGAVALLGVASATIVAGSWVIFSGHLEALRHGEFLVLLEIAPNLLWQAGLVGLNHYIFRKVTWADTRTYAVKEISKLINRHPDDVRGLFVQGQNAEARFWSEFVKAVQRVLNIPILGLLTFDDSLGSLCPRAVFPPADSQTAGPWTNVDRGIPRWVAENRNPILCPDLKWCSPLFRIEPMLPYRSELAVPIIVNDRVRGVLDARSPKTHSFDEGILLAFLTLAEAFGAALAQVDLVERETQYNYDLIGTLTEELRGSTTVASTMKIIVDWVCEHFGATSAVGFRLSPGLAWPLLPAISAGSFEIPAAVNEPITAQSILHRLTDGWQELFVTDTLSDRRLRAHAESTSPSSFVTREGIASTAFLPLGTSTRKIALLFVNYRSRQEFSGRELLALRALADAATLALLLQQDVEIRERARETIISVRHSGMHKNITNVKLLSAMVGRAVCAQSRDSPEGTIPNVSELIDSLRDNTTQLEERALEFLRAMEPDALSGLERVTVEDNLRQAAQLLRDKTDRWLLLKVDPDVDLEPHEVKIALYSIAYEAIHNALHHGKAQKVQARIERSSWSVALVVRDNGRGFKDVQNWSDIGIRARLKYVETVFGGKTRIRSFPNVGTVVRVQFPSRPKEASEW